MGYRLNHLDEPVFMAVPKPMRTVFGIHYRSESCGLYLHSAYHRSKTAKKRGYVVEMIRGMGKPSVYYLHPPYATTAHMLSNGRKLLTWWPKSRGRRC